VICHSLVNARNIPMEKILCRTNNFVLKTRNFGSQKPEVLVRKTRSFGSKNPKFRLETRSFG
jgi:DNA-directed RNA polymerase alpha subunit